MDPMVKKTIDNMSLTELASFLMFAKDNHKYLQNETGRYLMWVYKQKSGAK